MEAYCVKCKTKREMSNPQPIYTRAGQPATQGLCPVCGTKLTRMGRTPAHESLPAPERISSTRPKRRSAKRKSVKASSRARRDGKLVIVESPAKARTMSGYLGRGYRVKASIGHVRDLLKSRLSVDVDNDFAPSYTIPREKRSVVKELREEVQKAKEVYLATDPDREGEAIAWHLIEAAQITLPSKVHRVVFHEITPEAIRKAFAHPRGIDRNLVDAQQARRILDRLVGYKLSPLLWDKVQNRLSAGRVQSVALRLVVEREREIAAFVPQEFWTIDADLSKGTGERFRARLQKIGEEKIDLKTKDQVDPLLAALREALYRVASVEVQDKRRNPYPPFITSTLQQEASRRLRFSAKRTMRVAQELYEGVSLGPQGSLGLITYMRTDSVQVARDAQAEARAFIAERFGKAFLPATPPRYRTRAKLAQEAHEAIRPTSVRRTREQVKPYLSRDQQRLYELIWRRFLASQMAAARMKVTSADIQARPQADQPASDGFLLRASGTTLEFAGFLSVYAALPEEDENGDRPSVLPPLSQGEPLTLVELLPEQHFTKPPARYSEATLVKALEEYGIGRPSTYAPILATLQGRGYVESHQRRLRPSSLGTTVVDLLVEHFPDIMDVNFTAGMEAELDRIASGETEWVPVIRRFYEPFEKDLRKAQRDMLKVEIEPEVTDEICDRCGNPMLVKHGRYGKFLACSTFPACRNTKPYLVKIGVICPECGGQIVERRTRKGRLFYGCSNYPRCDFSSWQKPLRKPCPECGGLLVANAKGYALCLSCGTWIKPDEYQAMEEAAASSSASGGDVESELSEPAKVVAHPPADDSSSGPADESQPGSDASWQGDRSSD